MKICLLTPGQPSTNPRVVKEADALSEEGYEVKVFCAFWTLWALETDKKLLESRNWKCKYVGGNPIINNWYFVYTRLRNRLSRRIASLMPLRTRLDKWALCRVLSELESAATSTDANLFIAHYPCALPAAVKAARMKNAKVGFDAEDFHTESFSMNCSTSYLDLITQRIEKKYLQQCDYVTASSQGIADAYANKYGIETPTSILNVFPLSLRPSELRQVDNNNSMSLFWFSQTIGKDRGLEDVIKAMSVLKDCNIKLHLCGEWQPGYKEKLHTLMKSKKVTTNRIFYNKPIPAEEMIRYSANYDIGLALEKPETLNRNLCLTNKIFTYLLAGNAIVATNTTGQKTIMENIGGAGFSYEPGDAVTLANGLKKWYKDRNLLNKAREQSWFWGTKRYNWDLEKSKYLRKIEEVLTIPYKNNSSKNQ